MWRIKRDSARTDHVPRYNYLTRSPTLYPYSKVSQQGVRTLAEAVGMETLHRWLIVGFTLAIVGILVTMIGLLLTVAKSAQGKVEGGGVIVIGPLPIVFGTSEEITRVLLVLATILVAVSVGAYLILLRHAG